MSIYTIIECPNCGNTTNKIVPGIKRTACQFCGTTIFINQDISGKQRWKQTLIGNNPADIMSIYLDPYDVSLNVFSDSECAAHWITSTKEEFNLEIVPTFKTVQGFHNGIAHALQELEKQLEFFAVASYYSGQTYNIRVGKVALDRESMFCKKYWKKSMREFPDAPLTDEEWRAMKQDRSCEQYNDILNSLTLDFTSLLTKRYGFFYSEATRHTSPKWTDNNTYLSVVKFRERVLSVNMCPRTAMLLLANANLETIQEIQNLEFLKDVAADGYTFLNEESIYHQLDRHSVSRVSIRVESDSIHFYRGGIAPHYDDISLRTFGVEEIASEAKRSYIAAFLLSQLNFLATENETLRWRVGSITKSRYSDAYEYNLESELRLQEVYKTI